VNNPFREFPFPFNAYINIVAFGVHLSTIPFYLNWWV